MAARNPSITFAPTEASEVSGCSPPELRGFALLVLVCALAFPSVAQVTYSFSAPSPGVSWSFTVPALLTAENDNYQLRQLDGERAKLHNPLRDDFRSAGYAVCDDWVSVDVYFHKLLA